MKVRTAVLQFLLLAIVSLFEAAGQESNVPTLPPEPPRSTQRLDSQSTSPEKSKTYQVTERTTGESFTFTWTGPGNPTQADMKQKVKEIREGRRKLEIARALEREVRPKWYERMAWSLTPPYTILVVGFLLIGGLAALKRWEWVGRLQSGQLLLLAAFSGIGFFSIVSSNLAWDENKAAGPLVFLFAWSVLGSLKSVAEKAKEYRGTKMRQWHSGKIALLWIASFIWMAMLYGPVRSEIHYYPWSYNGWTSGDLGIAILFAAPPIAALVLTWLWLTGREKKPTKLRAYPER